MATTTAGMNTQLDKQSQTDNATPTLETRKLARLLDGTIHYHRKDLFYARLELGADINFYGLDDNNEYVLPPPLISAILFSNTWAFDELLRKGVNVHNGGKAGSTTPLFEAAAHGNVYMVRKLLANGANPLDYRKGTCLPLMLETITSSALLESESRWRYENESSDTDNADLKKQVSDFFLQEGCYTPPKPSAAIPFDAPEHVIHVHYEGKLEILGELLARHVSPTMPVSGTTRSPLELVRNPAKHPTAFQADPKEELEYVGTEAGNPNVLLFEMKFRNKRNTGTLPTKIVVHYDFEPSRYLIEGALLHSPQVHAVTQSLASKVEEDMRATGNRLDTQLVTVQTSVQAQLMVVQGQLSDVHGATTQFTQEMKTVKETVHYDEKQEIVRFKAFIKSHPNATEAYKKFKIGLAAIHTSALAVKGGGVTVSQGSFSLVASALGMGTELVDMIPVVGSAASKLFGLASAAAQQIDETRQTNLFKNIADMADPKEARKIFEAVARKLTMAYLQQFDRLATKEVAEQQMSRTQQFVQNAKGKVLNSRFKSPAEQVTAFAIIWMMDEVFNNAHKLDREIEEKGLETLLLNAVTQHNSPEKLTTFWNEITAKLGINAIPTQSASGAISGETWSPADFWTRPGVKIEDGQNSSAAQYFEGNNTDVAKFGWRSGSMGDVAALGLAPTTETAVLLSHAASPAATSTTATTPLANSRPTAPVLPPSPRMMYAYPSAPSSTSCKPEPCEGKVPTPPSAPKRAKSPFLGFRLPGFRRGCPTPLTTS
jgi:hypothetical protein